MRRFRFREHRVVRFEDQVTRMFDDVVPDLLAGEGRRAGGCELCVGMAREETAELEAAIEREIERIRKDGVTAIEMERSRTSVEGSRASEAHAAAEPSRLAHASTTAATARP